MAKANTKNRVPQCVVCGGPNERGAKSSRFITCSSRCSKLWVSVRLALSPEHREQHLKSMTRVYSRPQYKGTTAGKYAARRVQGKPIRPHHMKPYSEAKIQRLREVIKLRKKQGWTEGAEQVEKILSQGYGA